MIIQDAIKKAQQYAMRIQYPSGAWRGVLETNNREAEMLLFNYFMGIHDTTMTKKLIKRILNLQNTDGTWDGYYGSVGDLNTTTETYFAAREIPHDS